MIFRNARVWSPGADPPAVDVLLDGEPDEVDLAGRWLLPGLVNAHDHLDFSNFPPLGSPPYRSLYEWSAAVNAGAGDVRVQKALAMPVPDRAFLGGIRNLLAGVTAVAHHGPHHRSMGRDEFPVKVLERYQFAHSPGLTPQLRKTYRSTDRRIPWMIHAAEGLDDVCRAELGVLREANLVRQNTVLVHGIGLPEEAFPELAEAGVCVVWCPESNRFLYGATAPVGALRAAGVRVGLGSDSPISGVRDALSNLEAARDAAVLSDDDLLQLATVGSGEVVRMPVGGITAGAPADFLITGSLEGILRGERSAVDLVVVAGERRYGVPELMPEDATAVRVDGASKHLERRLARRLRSLLAAHPVSRQAPWLSKIDLD